MIKQKKQQQNKVIIYRPKKGSVKFEVKLEKETIWLDVRQMANIFDVQRPAVVKHINNIYKSKELDKKITCSILEQVAGDKKIRKINLYNLDMVISVGYRVNSKKATEFRIWATTVLKKYLFNGYILNKKRLQEKGLDEFENAVELIKQTIKNKKILKSESQGLLEIITDYAQSWILLQKYDEEKIPTPKTKKSKIKLKLQDFITAVTELKINLLKQKNASHFFGKEKAKAEFEKIINSLYQTFDKKELYPSIEEKAAHLLYFVIKDHPFVDGNKRIASFLFIVFLSKHNYLLKKDGEKKINDNTLVALALLTAQSDPKQKDIIIKLLINFLSEK